MHALALLLAPQAQEELDGPAQDLVDALARIERRVCHLVHELDLAKLVADALADRRPELVAVEQDVSVEGGGEPRHHARQRRLAAARFADHADHLAALDGHVAMSNSTFIAGEPSVLRP